MIQGAYIVIPCYNEEHRLPVSALEALLAKEARMHILFADDGSTDRTVECCQRVVDAFPSRVHLHQLERNSGKGEAVRQGVLAAIERWPEAEYVGYFDADLATPLTESLRLFEICGARRPFIIMGSRVDLLGSSDIKRSPIRHYLGRVFATMVSLQLGVAVYDTQCGAKLIRSDQVRALFGEPFLTRWLFDVELIWRCMAMTGRTGLSQYVLELPLARWHEMGGSKVRLSDGIKVPLGLMRIARYYRGRVKK